MEKKKTAIKINGFGATLADFERLFKDVADGKTIIKTVRRLKNGDVSIIAK